MTGWVLCNHSNTTSLRKSHCIYMHIILYTKCKYTELTTNVCSYFCNARILRVICGATVICRTTVRIYETKCVYCKTQKHGNTTWQALVYSGLMDSQEPYSRQVSLYIPQMCGLRSCSIVCTFPSTKPPPLNTVATLPFYP